MQAKRTHSIDRLWNRSSSIRLMPMATRPAPGSRARTSSQDLSQELELKRDLEPRRLGQALKQAPQSGTIRTSNQSLPPRRSRTLQPGLPTLLTVKTISKIQGSMDNNFKDVAILKSS